MKDKKTMPPDIEKRTFDFSIKIINFCRNARTQDFINQVILKQLIRSGTSVGANTTEGRASSSKKDFINFHYHALKSARETRYWLRLLQNASTNIKSSEGGGALLKEVEEIGKILGKIVITSRKNI